MANIHNGRCFDQIAAVNEPPLVQNGSLVLQPHDIGWIVSGAFTFVAIAVSFWLIDRHLVWYTNKREQRYIVRILFMVPIYAVISFASYLFWNHSTALLLIRDCYESTVLTAFFYLLLTYLSPDPAEQKEIFRKVGVSREQARDARQRGVAPAQWMFPLSLVRWKPEDGLYFFQLMKWGVLQYCVMRPVTTLMAVILNYIGLYCDDSWSAGWGHLYITVAVSISVTVAMYCLLQLYFPIAPFLAPQKPLLKLFAIKAVVFLTFWQATVIDLVQSFGGITSTPSMTADNVSTGIAALAETFEMMLFALLHIAAFRFRPYAAPPGPTPRLPALAHAFNFAETLRELAAAARYAAHRLRGRETDVQARREAALESVFGRSRMHIAGRVPALPEEKPPAVDERIWADGLDGEQLWLREEARREKGGDETARARSALGKVSGTRGEYRDERRAAAERRAAPKAKYDLLRQAEHGGGPADHVRKERLWWRDAYSTVAGCDKDQPRAPPDDPPRSHAYDLRYDDPPPASAIRSYRHSQRQAAAHQAALAAPAPRPAAPNALQLHPGPSAPASPDPSPAPSAPSHAPSASSDSFLARAFADVAYTSGASDAATSAGVSSPPSHSAHVQPPAAAPRRAEVVRGGAQSRARGESVGARRPPQELPRAQRADGARRLSAPLEQRPAPEWRRSAGPRGVNRFTPAPGRIVLPAPLAPAAPPVQRPTHIDMPAAPWLDTHPPTPPIGDAAWRTAR